MEPYPEEEQIDLEKNGSDESKTQWKLRPDTWSLEKLIEEAGPAYSSSKQQKVKTVNQSYCLKTRPEENLPVDEIKFQLMDIGLKIKGFQEDRNYALYPELRQNVRRGGTLINIEMPEGADNHIQHCRQGIPKFFGFKQQSMPSKDKEGKHCFRLKSLNKQERGEREQVVGPQITYFDNKFDQPEDTRLHLRICESIKANGENAQVSFFPWRNVYPEAAEGSGLWIIASKNVSIPLRDRKDMWDNFMDVTSDSYKGAQRFSFALKIANAWFDLLEFVEKQTNPEVSVAKLKSLLSNVSLIGEYILDKDCQHITKYEYENFGAADPHKFISDSRKFDVPDFGQKGSLCFYSDVQNKPGGEYNPLCDDLAAQLSAHGVCVVPLSHDEKAYTLMEFFKIADQLRQKQALSKLEEGSVMYTQIYLVDEGRYETIAMCKLKTLLYMAIRKMREKMRHHVSDVLSKKKSVPEKKLKQFYTEFVNIIKNDLVPNFEETHLEAAHYEDSEEYKESMQLAVDSQKMMEEAFEVFENDWIQLDLLQSNYIEFIEPLMKKYIGMDLMSPMQLPKLKAQHPVLYVEVGEGVDIEELAGGIQEGNKSVYVELLSGNADEEVKETDAVTKSLQATSSAIYLSSDLTQLGSELTRALCVIGVGSFKLESMDQIDQVLTALDHLKQEYLTEEKAFEEELQAKLNEEEQGLLQVDGLWEKLVDILKTKAQEADKPQSHLLFVIPIGTPGMGKSYIKSKLISADKGTNTKINGTSVHFSHVSSDECRKMAMELRKSRMKNQNISKDELFEKSRKEADKMYQDEIKDFLYNESLRAKDGEAYSIVYLDKNHMPNGLSKAVQQPKDFSTKHGNKVHFVCLTNYETYKADNLHVFSIPTLTECLCRLLLRSDHDVLSNENPLNVIKILSMFASSFNGEQFNDNFFSQFNVSDHLEVCMTTPRSSNTSNFATSVPNDVYKAMKEFQNAIMGRPKGNFQRVSYKEMRANLQVYNAFYQNQKYLADYYGIDISGGGIPKANTELTSLRELRLENDTSRQEKTNENVDSGNKDGFGDEEAKLSGMSKKQRRKELKRREKQDRHDQKYEQDSEKLPVYLGITYPTSTYFPYFDQISEKLQEHCADHELTEEVVSLITSITSNNAENDGWTVPENMHITTLFVGSISGGSKKKSQKKRAKAMDLIAEVETHYGEEEQTTYFERLWYIPGQMLFLEADFSPTIVNVEQIHHMTMAFKAPWKAFNSHETLKLIQGHSELSFEGDDKDMITKEVYNEALGFLKDPVERIVVFNFKKFKMGPLKGLNTRTY